MTLQQRRPVIAANRRRPVTMADVGEHAGVTARTVSNVLSSKVPVRPETRDAVLRAVDELGYQLNVSARGLRTGQTGFITLAIPDLAIEYFAELARAVMIESEQYGWTVVIQQTGGRRDAELAVLSGASRQLSDGLIFQPHALGPNDKRILSTDSPLILLGDRIFDGPVDHVTMANADATAMATRYLLDRGRRHLAAIGANSAGGPISAAALRLKGFSRTLANAGVPLDPALIGVAREWRQSNGALAMTQVLDTGIPIDGVVCFNDSLALGALHTLSARGIRVPDDIAVIGFDNISAAEFANPSLTTIEPGRAQIASTAVDLLAQRIEHGLVERPREIVADFSLIARRSA